MVYQKFAIVRARPSSSACSFSSLFIFRLHSRESPGIGCGWVAEHLQSPNTGGLQHDNSFSQQYCPGGHKFPLQSVLQFIFDMCIFVYAQVGGSARGGYLTQPCETGEFGFPLKHLHSIFPVIPLLFQQALPLTQDNPPKQHAAFVGFVKFAA